MPPEIHEVFPNAPLALVVVEARFPSALAAGDRPLTATQQRAFRDVLGPDWVIESVKTQRLDIALGPSVTIPQPAQAEVVSRFTVRDRTLAVAVTGESVTVETTAYTHYADLRHVLESALNGTTEIVAPDGISRIGMRYINEVRVDAIDGSNPSAWKEWLHPSLLPPALVEMANTGFPATAWDGAVQYHTGADSKIVMRYGARMGQMLNPGSRLRRLRPPRSDAFFLLDFDSFWEPSDSIPEFNSGDLVDACDRLRTPIRAVFDHMLTESLLREFRKEPTSD